MKSFSFPGWNCQVIMNFMLMSFLLLVVLSYCKK